MQVTIYSTVIRRTQNGDGFGDMGTICVKHREKTGCEFWRLGPLGLVWPQGHDAGPCGVWVSCGGHGYHQSTGTSVWRRGVGSQIISDKTHLANTQNPADGSLLGVLSVLSVPEWNNLEFENQRVLAIIPMRHGMRYDSMVATRIGGEAAIRKPLLFVIYILHSKMDRADVRD